MTDKDLLQLLQDGSYEVRAGYEKELLMTTCDLSFQTIFDSLVSNRRNPMDFRFSPSHRNPPEGATNEYTN